MTRLLLTALVLVCAPSDRAHADPARTDARVRGGVGLQVVNSMPLMTSWVAVRGRPHDGYGEFSAGLATSASTGWTAPARMASAGFRLHFLHARVEPLVHFRTGLVHVDGGGFHPLVAAALGVDVELATSWTAMAELGPLAWLDTERVVMHVAVGVARDFW